MTGLFRMNGDAMEMVIKGGLGSATCSSNCRANGAKRKSCETAGIRQARFFSTEQHEIVACSVSCLDGLSSPNAVFSRVAHGVVQPLKRMVRAWFPPHVRQEVPEVSPRRIYRDTAASIMWIHLMLRVRRAANHPFPGRVFRSAPRSPAVSMLSGRSSQAATRLSMAFAKLRCGKIGLFPARTDAYPANQAGLLLGATQHGQLTKDMADQIKSTSAKGSFISASARFCVPATQLSATYQGEASAHTTALPFRCVDVASKYMQVIKLLSCKFHNVPLYHPQFFPSRPTTIHLNGGGCYANR